MANTFPDDFLWGAATSAYQIEGSPLADGAGPSNWHHFAHLPGKIADGTHGDFACDHYHRFAEDIALMRDLGLNSYRFSINWARLLPQGIGPINRTGLDFYSRLVDLLLENNIEPMATLFHWDYPQALEEQGGWADDRSPDWFVEYASIMFRELDDRVKLWVTHNEPWVVVDQGYVEGMHAPGRRDRREAAAVSRNLLISHGRAVKAYRSIGRHKIGLVVNLLPIKPATDTPADHAAANRLDAYINRQFLDPALLGTVPEELPQMFGDDWIGLSQQDLAIIKQPIDFVGMNYYLRLVVRDEPAGGLARTAAVPQPASSYTAMGWEIYPRGLTEILEGLKQTYGNLPLYITENGAAFDDVLLPNGDINDRQRVQYLDEHLRAVAQAIAHGVDVRGYYLWSLLDNFEWQQGCSKRFGIVRVDFETLERRLKKSAHFYSDFIRAHSHT